MRVRGQDSLSHRNVSITLLLSLIMIRSALSSDWLMINEVLYDSTGQDVGCFVELIGTPGLGLDGYFLAGAKGEDGKEYNFIDLSGHTVPNDGYFVVAQDESVLNADMIDSKADYQNGPDNIELWHGDNMIDSVGYGDFSKAVFAGEAAPTLDVAGYSIGRRPDGLDTNNNSIDFVGLAVASPGAPNGPTAAVLPAGKLISAWGKIRHEVYKKL